MPVGSMAKFFDERGGAAHRGSIWWPGTVDGFPYRGDAPPLLKAHEAANVAAVMDFHSRRFNLWVPEDKAAFDDIMDRVVNGWYAQHKRFDRWQMVEGLEQLSVWLEWVQIYGETITGKSPRNAHTSGV